MKFKILIVVLVGCALFGEACARAKPLVLSVRPEGTNQVELTFGPVVSNCLYEVLVRTNSPRGHWRSFGGGFIGGGEDSITATRDLGGAGELRGLTLATLKNWTFVAGYSGDSDGDGLPDIYEDLATRSDPFSADTGDTGIPDGYKDPDGDGWNNLQEMAGNTDPLTADRPLEPHSEFAMNPGTNGPSHASKATIHIHCQQIIPEYFEIEKSQLLRRSREEIAALWQERFPGRPVPGQLTNRPGFPNNTRFGQPPGATPQTNGFPGTNRFPRTNQFARTNRFAWTNRPSGPGMNQPPFQRGPSGGYPGLRHEDLYKTNLPHIIARIPARPGVKEYTYEDTNVTAGFDPAEWPKYRVLSHFVPPPRQVLNRLDATTILGTILPVRAEATTNGYALTVLHPIPHGRYLLLVRDRNDRQWRASGYFMGGTNRDPVHLKVDATGMMGNDQRPLQMPVVKFLAKAVEPEFTAGWGEDSDGDGLPDIYEVLVTKTDPFNADTGNMGVLDGYKELGNDGWSCLEKFRRRVDPHKAFSPPEPSVLKQPTYREAIQAITTPGTDLRYEPQVEVRVIGTTNFQKANLAWTMLYQISKSDPRNRYDAHPNFDLRISWVIPERKPRSSEYSGP